MPDPITPLEIPADILRQMVEHCQREAPLECCGILGGHPPRVSSLHILRNTLASETRYNANPLDILETVRTLRSRGHQFLAIYHSHPSCPATPSRTDLVENFYGDLPRIIVSLQTDPPVVRNWRFEPSSYVELPWVTPADDDAVSYP